jgi:uncharacterized membrane protein
VFSWVAPDLGRIDTLLRVSDASTISWSKSYGLIVSAARVRGTSIPDLKHSEEAVVMAKDVGDAIGAAIGHAAREVVETVSANARKGSKKPQLPQMPQLSGGRGVAAGAAAAALVPLAAKGAGKMMHSLRNGAGGAVQDAVGKTVEGAGGASGLAKEAGKAMLPFGGGDGKKGGGGGVGHGRRMPIQQAVDVALPIKDAYEKWTEYEEWPKFMHRLDRVSQEDDTNISFKAKIWGISREFKAEIIDEQEGERIKWRVTEGVSHTGVVTFHELGPRLTRIDVDIDVHPGSMIEKLGRGLRHAKRAVRADLHRFKAHVEIEEDLEDQGGEEQEEKPRRSASSRSRSAGRVTGGSAGRGTGRSSRGSGGSSRSSGGSASRGGARKSSSGGGSNGASASGGSSSRGRSRSSSSSSSSNGSRASRAGGGSRRRTAASSKS